MSTSDRRRLGEWLPIEEHVIARFREEFSAHARKRATVAKMNSAVADLAAFIRGDPVVRMDFTEATRQARDAGFTLGYASIDEFIVLLDAMMTCAPPFSESSLSHCPLNALLDWPMVMPFGYALFRDPAFNAHLKRILNVWAGFLSGPHSRTHLNKGDELGYF